jgi:hypothetical protein
MKGVMKSVAKWDGAALASQTRVSGAAPYQTHFLGVKKAPQIVA